MKGHEDKPSIENKNTDSSKITPPVKQPSDASIKDEAESKSERTNESQKGILVKYIKPWLPTFFATIMAYLAFQQTCISCNITRITKDATRPYLVVEDFKLRPLDTVGVEIRRLVAGKRFIVDYIIRNKGQTPAYNVIDSVRTAILDSGATLPMPPHNWNNKFIVGSEIQRFKQSQHIFSEESRRKISAKLDKSPADHWVYFWGKITYTDISDNTYWTEFGHRYIFEHGQWFPYKEYNKAN